MKKTKNDKKQIKNTKMIKVDTLEEAIKLIREENLDYFIKNFEKGGKNVLVLYAYDDGFNVVKSFFVELFWILFLFLFILFWNK